MGLIGGTNSCCRRLKNLSFVFLADFSQIANRVFSMACIRLKVIDISSLISSDSERVKVIAKIVNWTIIDYLLSILYYCPRVI